MFTAPVNNIINSKDWGNENWLSYFQRRLEDMKSKREEVENEWDSAENQVTNISFYNNYGELEVDVPLETNVIEIYMGRTNGKIQYEIQPNGQANIDELQPSKYIMEYFLDGNNEENFWKENKDFRNYKATYGTGVRCTAHRSVKDYRYELKDDLVNLTNEDILNEKNYNQIENETYYFFPQNIHPRDFYIDDYCYGEQGINNADDCILKEKLTWSQFKMRYGDNKNFDIDNVQNGIDEDPKNKNDYSIEQDYVIIHHYYHKITKKYLVVANERKIVYNGLYFYKDGKLPFVVVPHYTNINRIRGDGIPKRIGYLKAYKSEILQDILTGAAMSSGINLITGNDDEIGQDWTIGGRQLNLWKTTGGADRVQQVSTSPNLGYFATVLNIIDDLVVQDTGDNPRSPYDMTTDKVGIVEIQEANKAVRQASVDENYNIGLDEALTQMLSRIQQYAPILMSKKVYSDSGELLKVIYPSITMKGYEEVKEKDGKKVIKESMGKFGYYELKPNNIPGGGVKVVTSSTNSITPILQKQKITEYINNLMSLFNVAKTDPTGEMMKKLSQFVRFDELLGWMSDAYGYDINGLKANTEKDKQAEENLKKINALKEALKFNTQGNVGNMENQSLGGAGSEIQQPNQEAQGVEEGLQGAMNALGQAQGLQ